MFTMVLNLHVEFLPEISTESDSYNLQNDLDGVYYGEGQFKILKT